MGQLVAVCPTPFTPLQMCDLLVAAWGPQLGVVPKHSSIAVLAAQIALETANGKSCQNGNVGNYKKTDGHDWYEVLTTEYVDGYPQPVVCAFTSFPDLESGVAYFLNKAWSQWTAAWPAVIAGDPTGYAKGLHDQGYYTAPVAQYAAGVVRWFGPYMTLLGPDPSPDDTQPQPVVIG